MTFPISTTSPPRLIHELPGRLRFRLPLLSVRGINHSYLQALVEEAVGVHRVRLNRVALAIVVDYDGRLEARKAIFSTLFSLSPHSLPKIDENCACAQQPDLSKMMLSALSLVGALVLPRAFRPALTFVNVLPTLLRGGKTLLTEGLKVEVLDAIAIGLPVSRHEFTAANTAQVLLDLGGFLEASSVRHTDDLLRHLLHPNPSSVWVEGEDGVVIEVPFSSVREGDRVVVQTGELIPVDGEVASGTASVNQASVTGESLPIPKEEGSSVLAGTVVEQGRLTVIAQRVGNATTTARITSFIQDALGRRSSTQSMVHEIADKRILITLASGALVFALTRDWRRLQAIFLVDFSCAAKLSATVAIKTAMFRAASHGILAKGSQAIEGMARADTVVFDKTGTLTHSTLDVVTIEPFVSETCDADAILAAVASIAEHSVHPVAAAVVDLAHRRKLSHIIHEEVEFIVGHGLATRVGDHFVLIGSRHFLESHHGISFAQHEARLAELESAGNILLYVGRDHQPIGVIALRDRVRAEASDTLRRLKALGITRTVMITGDRKSKALQLGEALGIDEIHAEVPPEGKAAIVASLKAAGRTVIFVGDGVNDAPAMMAANVGVAMGAGAAIARATADVVLLEDRLGSVADAREMAVATTRLMKTNVRVAVGMNAGLLVGAALGRLPPVTTALLHNGTTIGVILNAMINSGKIQGAPRR